MTRMRLVALLCVLSQLGLGLTPLCALAEASRPYLAESAADTTGHHEEGWLTPGRKSYRWGLIGSAVGMGVGVGIALWVKSEADNQYDVYLATADPAKADEFFKASERYDRAALLGFGLAEISFVGLVYFLTRDRDREMVPTRGEPTLRVTPDGPQVGFRVHP